MLISQNKLDTTHLQSLATLGMQRQQRFFQVFFLPPPSFCTHARKLSLSNSFLNKKKWKQKQTRNISMIASMLRNPKDPNKYPDSDQTVNREQSF